MAGHIVAGGGPRSGRVEHGVKDEVTFVNDNTLYVVGEGGGKAQPGAFAQLTCTLADENPGR